jgi:glycosyltransferase involved in cell wall biosynthesis
MRNNYDVIIICFANPTLDARTINLVKTLIKYERTVALVTPNHDVIPDYIDNSDYYPCKINLNQKVRHSQKEFTKSVKKLKLSGKFVHAGDFYSLAVAKSLKMKNKAKLVYDSREIYSQLNSLKDRPFARKLLEFREKYLVTYVDKMVVTADVDASYLKRLFTHSIPYHVIKNLPPKQKLEESNELREKFKVSPDNLVLLYQGWVLEGRGLDTIVYTMKEIDFAELVLIGGGEYLDKLKELVTKEGLEAKVHFTGLIPYEKLSKATMSADVGLVLFSDESISYQNALPNKLFEFIQAGIPVITSNQKTMSEIVNNDNIGIVIKKVESAELQLAIQKMSVDTTRNNFKENIMKIRDKYNYESQEVEILKVYS